LRRIAVASTNPVKIQAALAGFQRIFSGTSFSVEGVSVPSGVRHQPISDEETLQGAHNRAANVCAAVPDAAYWVGIEGGIEEKHGEMLAFAWVVILSAAGRGIGRTGAFCLPTELADLVRQGVELGEADDRVFGRSNSKQANGAVGILTADVIDRTAYYVHAVALALIPFCNPTLTFPR
jgi:inosine/xanthosine triphosphatase